MNFNGFMQKSRADDEQWSNFCTGQKWEDIESQL